MTMEQMLISVLGACVATEVTVKSEFAPNVMLSSTGTLLNTSGPEFPNLCMNMFIYIYSRVHIFMKSKLVIDFISLPQSRLIN